MTSFGEAVDAVDGLVELAQDAGDDGDELLDMVCSELGWSDRRWAAVVIAMHRLYQGGSGVAGAGTGPQGTLLISGSVEELAQHSDYLDAVLALYRRWYVEGDPVSTPEMAEHLLTPLVMLRRLPVDEDARVLVERLAVFAATAIQRMVCESSAGVAG